MADAGLAGPGRLWADFGRPLAPFGPTLDRLWTVFGSTVVLLWADFGPNLGQLWAILTWVWVTSHPFSSMGMGDLPRMAHLC